MRAPSDEPRYLVDNADVILVCMPWATVVQPSIQLGLLTAHLNAAGISVKSFYTNLKFSEELGLDRYEKYGQYDSIFAKWVFSESLFGKFSPPPPNLSDFFDFAKSRGISQDELEELVKIKEGVSELLAWCLDSVDWQGAKVVGFTTTLLQTMPSLVLAKRLKSLFPHLKIILGGAACQGEMGQALHRNFQFIDGVVTGEGETVIVPLVRQIFEGRERIGLRGLIWRDSEDHVTFGGASQSINMRDYLSPEYHDYFVQKSALPSGSSIRTRLPFEASRGCWWAEVKQCKFCGLNGETLKQRTRPTEAVVGELRRLHARYNTHFFFAMDNILDRDQIEVLPQALQEALPNCEFFFEVRVTMRRHQMKTLAEAGVIYMQPGIESLITEVLHLVDKGTNAILNLCFLRRCLEFGITPYWNLLHGFPGERREWYDRLIAEAPRFFHLPCPDVVRYGLHRFSPFFDDPGRYGIKVTGPLDGNQYIWNLPENEIRDLSFELDFDLPENGDIESLTRDLEKMISSWRSSKAMLKAKLTERGQVAVHDSRPGFADIYLLPMRASYALRSLEQPTSQNSIIDTLAGHGLHIPGEPVAPEDLRADLDLLAERGLIYFEKNKYLALTVPAQKEFWLSDQKVEKPNRS